MPGHIRSRGKRADGSTVWQARWRHPDRLGHRREANFKTKREAERWITSQESGVLRGEYADPHQGQRRFAEVAAEWRDTWNDLEPKTRAGYEAILDCWLIGESDPLRRDRPARFRDVKVGVISTAVIQDFVNEVNKVRAPNTVRRIYSVLRAVLRVAVERRYIVANPCNAVKLPRKGSGSGSGSAGGRMLFLSPAEVRTLADAMPANYQLPTYVAAYCGLRAGELWALRRRDVDPLHGVLHIERALKEINSSAASLAEDKGLIFGPTKTHATRKLTLPAFLVPLLAEQASGPSLGGTAPDDLLFTSPTGKPVRHNLFYKRVFKPVVRSALPARLDGLRWHDLRHTAAALSLAVSPNLHIVKERLGHNDIRTTINIYGHMLPSVDDALAVGLDALHTEARDNVTDIGLGSS